VFSHDPWRSGIRTRATVERVVATSGQTPLRSGSPERKIYVTFRLTDESGQEILQERAYFADPMSYPAPGITLDVAYLPGRPETIMYDVTTAQLPDAGIPRGWGDGIFGVDDLGTHRAHSLGGDRDIGRDRELFRTGRRATGRVISVDEPGFISVERRGLGHYTIHIDVDGTTYAKKVWTIRTFVPRPGDLIKVALDPRGREIALDADERFQGPPGVALVFTRPGGARDPQVPASGPAEDSLPELLNRLARLHQSGALSEAEFAAAKQRLLR
jgi:hypothetical protein